MDEFLEYMRHPSAAAFVRDIKRFIASFSSNARDSDRDGEAVQEFVRNMEASFRVHPLWSGCAEEKLEMVGEGLEKYVMKKLFARVFRLEEDDSLMSNKIDLVGRFVQPEHLDFDPAAIFRNEDTFCLAQKELQYMDLYKAPGDKLACILRCCKAISNLLLSQNPAAGADEFLPVLIYVTIKANPPNLHSNLCYIQRFRGESRLVSEPAYFFTSMLSAENFIANMDARSLSMDATEFENRMKLSEDSDGGRSRIKDEEVTNGNDRKLEGVDSWTNPRNNKEEVLCEIGSVSDLEDKGARLIRKKDGFYPFLNTKAAGLTVGNVDDLLHRYKKLVFKLVCLCQGLESISSDFLD